MHNDPITLQELTLLVDDALRDDTLSDRWVTAEITDFSVRRHCYLTLVQKNDDGETIAQMRANIWANVYQPLAIRFLKATGRDLSNGIKVMLRGSVAFHGVYGLSFQVSDIDPNYTLGDIERRRREIIAKLKDEGIIDRNKQLSLPPNPQRIAIISSTTAAGYGDFVHQLESNPLGIRFHTHTFPASMQGQDTVEAVLSALRKIQQHAHLFDCVAIVRGGGSSNDLNWFDDYQLAKSVALFPLPVLTGIGHLRDVCVLDEVACHSLKTPTAVASFLIATCEEQLTWISNTAGCIKQLVRTFLSNESLRQETLLNNIMLSAKELVARNMRATDILSHRIKEAAGTTMNRESNRLSSLEKTLAVTTKDIVSQKHHNLDYLGLRLKNALTLLLNNEHNKVDRLEGKVQLLSPQNVLNRGYSLTTINGKAVTDAGQLHPGDEISTRLKNGVTHSIVINI